MATNCCGNGTKLLYSCSGASDIGELADRVARKLWQEGLVQRTCTAAVGADLPGYVLSAKEAKTNITIDGCQLACAKKCLENIGVTPQSYIISEMGYTKGNTPIDEETIENVYRLINKSL